MSFDRFKAAHADKRGGGSLAASLDELAECIASRGGVDEAAAHRLLQKHAMNSGVSLRRVAEEILQKYAHDNKLDYFNILVEKKGFVKAVTSLIGQLSRSGAKMEEIYEALNGWDRPGKLGLKDREIAAVL